MSYSHTDLTETINISGNRTLWTTLFVLVMALAFITIYPRYYRTQSEQYVGNIGTQGDYVVQTEKEKKQLGCYQDNDCPDETVCGDKGICIPLIHKLPTSMHMLKQGRGREKEKSSG